MIEREAVVEDASAARDVSTATVANIRHQTDLTSDKTHAFPPSGSHANYVCRRTSAAVRQTGRVQSSVNTLSGKRERTHAMQL